MTVDEPSRPAPDPLPERADPSVPVTPARLGLGRAGSGMPTRAVLDFAVAHAKARDAVHLPLDAEALATRLRALGPEVIGIKSAAPDRETYLRRPDFGRRLSAGSRTVLAARARQPSDLLVVIGDGLSATAVAENAEPLLAELLPMLRSRQLILGPLVLATQARVALGDEIGGTLATRLVLVLIGERPGLSAADSLGAYLTFDPRIGRSDAERNCVSNIRPGGLSHAGAAVTLMWLIDRALGLGLTGVRLKDESRQPILPKP